MRSHFSSPHALSVDVEVTVHSPDFDYCERSVSETYTSRGKVDVSIQMRDCDPRFVDRIVAMMRADEEEDSRPVNPSWTLSQGPIEGEFVEDYPQLPLRSPRR